MVIPHFYMIETRHVKLTFFFLKQKRISNSQLCLSKFISWLDYVIIFQRITSWIKANEDQRFIGCVEGRLWCKYFQWIDNCCHQCLFVYGCYLTDKHILHILLNSKYTFDYFTNQSIQSLHVLLTLSTRYAIFYTICTWSNFRYTFCFSTRIKITYIHYSHFIHKILVDLLLYKIFFFHYLHIFNLLIQHKYKQVNGTESIC